MNDNATVTSYIVEKARRHAVVNVLPIGAITKGSAGEELAAIGSMKQAGAVAISDDGRPVMNARVMRRAMEFARSFGIPVIDHCEDLHLSAGGDMHEGLESVRLGLRGIPGCSEDVMVARDILLAEVTGARYHVAHISSRHAVEMVAFAKARGLSVTAEATPHHLALADADMASVRQQLQNEAAAAIALRRGRGGGRSGERSDRRDRHGSRAASGVGEDAGVREMPVRDYWAWRPRWASRWSNLVHPGKIGLHAIGGAVHDGSREDSGISTAARLAPGLAADVTIFSTDASGLTT